MTHNPQGTLAALRRPRILIRAARFGLAEYRRERDLPRLLGEVRPAAVVDELLAREAMAEADRARGAAGYSPARHVELLIALIAEAARATVPAAQAKASVCDALRRRTNSSSASAVAGSSAGG